MPYVPAHLDGRLHRLDPFVDCRIGIAEAVRPEHLPCEQLGIAQHEAPHSHIEPIDWALALMRRGNKFLQFEKALARAIRVDAARFRLGDAVLTEARDVSAFRAAVAGAKHIREGPLAL